MVEALTITPSWVAAFSLASIPFTGFSCRLQPEYNDIWWKQSLDGQTTSNGTYNETSFLVGGGLRFGAPGAKTWGFAAVLFDVGGNTLSPL